jgi:2-polyprenyl-3-methyl-5-hydroxy-6-metoxy-1,4-benzoquinol methylase
MTRAKALPTAGGRDLNTEFLDTEDRKYAYGFDYRMHGYMLRTFAEDLPRGRALELGCFEGEFTKRLGEIYEDLTVVEGASELIGVAKARAPEHVNFVLSRFEDYEPDEAFDAIFLIHTLEHMEDAVALLKRIRGWLGEKGRLFLVVPNANAASRQIAVEMGLITAPTAVTEGEYAHGHRRTYNLSTLKGDIVEAGLFAIKSGGVFFKPFANFQFDKLIGSGLIGEDYLEGCYQFGKRHPDLCASIYAICEPWSGKPYTKRGSR